MSAGPSEQQTAVLPPDWRHLLHELADAAHALVIESNSSIRPLASTQRVGNLIYEAWAAFVDQPADEAPYYAYLGIPNPLDA